MKIFVAGATGAIGRRLIPMLIAHGHRVVASIRTPDRAEAFRSAGAEPAIMDGLNQEAVIKAVMAARPDAIVHQMTALASVHSLRNFDREFALTNRLRTQGTEYLIAAAQAAGTPRLVVQSYTGWPNARQGGRTKTEDDALDPNPPKKMAESLTAIRRLEELVTNAPGLIGIVLRYGNLYGPGTSISRDGEIVKLVREREFPIVGNGGGVWSFVHVDDAASAAQAALAKDAPGIYNVVDDEPAEVSVWLPALASAIGAKPPRRIPEWLGRLVLGEPVLLMMTKIRGSSNAKVKRTFDWRPAFASWRKGFAALAREEAAPAGYRMQAS